MKNRKSGFTLVEVLVVVVIIMILMTIVFRLSKATSNVGERASTSKLIQTLSAAIEEFHAEYGIYPPSGGENGTGFRYPRLQAKTKGKLGLLPGDIKHGNIEDMFEFGLLFYLALYYPNEEEGPISDVKDIYDLIGTASSRRTVLGDTVWEDHFSSNWEQFESSTRDANFAKRIKNFLDEIDLGDRFDFVGKVDSHGNRPADVKSNCMHISLGDGWGRPLIYECKPPYTSYVLVSCGPDGKCDKSDLLDRTKAENKDNIYGGVGNL